MHTIRLLVVALLAANLVFIGVEAQRPPVERPKSEPLADGAKAQLRLAHEIDPGADRSAGLECFTVGPFENESTSRALTELLEPFAVDASSRTTEAFVDRGFWVYVPPPDSLRTARLTLDQLYDAGFEDIGLIDTGPWSGAISLGYFTRSENAKRRRTQVTALNIPVEIEVRREDEARHWVDYRQRAGSMYAYQALADLVPPGLHRPTACGPAGDEQLAGIGD